MGIVKIDAKNKMSKKTVYQMADPPSTLFFPPEESTTTRTTNALVCRRNRYIQVLRWVEFVQFVEFDPTETQEGVVRSVRAVESSRLVGLVVPQGLGKHPEAAGRILEAVG